MSKHSEQLCSVALIVWTTGTAGCDAKVQYDFN